MTIYDVAEKFKSVLLTPGELSEIRIWLAGEYSFLSEKLHKILGIKAEKWLEIRNHPLTNSDAKADKIWEATDEGKIEREIRFQLKAIEKLLSASRTRLEVMSAESKMQM